MATDGRAQGVDVTFNPERLWRIVDGGKGGGKADVAMEIAEMFVLTAAPIAQREPAPDLFNIVVPFRNSSLYPLTPRFPAIVGFYPYARRLLSVVVLLTALSGVAYADARSDAKAQVEFGIAVAQRGLWKEAIYRWERATQIDPTYAAGFNNLAVAYEHEGMLDKAAEAYERALKLEPNNALVRQNFELFKEIHDRTTQSQTP